MYGTNRRQFMVYFICLRYKQKDCLYLTNHEHLYCSKYYGVTVLSMITTYFVVNCIVARHVLYYLNVL